MPSLAPGCAALGFALVRKPTIWYWVACGVALSSSKVWKIYGIPSVGDMRVSAEFWYRKSQMDWREDKSGYACGPLCQSPPPVVAKSHMKPKKSTLEHIWFIAML